VAKSEAKIIRGQVRQVVAEILPDLLKEAFYKEIGKLVSERLDVVGKNMDGLIKDVNERVEATLNAVNERTKDIQDLVVRSVAAPVLQPQSEEGKPGTDLQ
jgi:hypothetical protein